MRRAPGSRRGVAQPQPHFARRRIDEPQNPQWSQYLAQWWLGIYEIELRSGSLNAAISAIETSQRITPTAWRSLRILTTRWVRIAEAARTSTQLTEDERREVIDRCLMRGLDAFSQSVDAGYDDMADLQSEPALDPLRALPGWSEIEQRVLDRAASSGG